MSSWVDITIVNSILAGCSILPLLCWSWWYHNYLWQELFWRDCKDSMEAANALGFAFRKRGLKACWAMEKNVSNTLVVVKWIGGPFGARSIVQVGMEKHRCPLLRTESELISELSRLAPISMPQHG